MACCNPDTCLSDQITHTGCLILDGHSTPGAKKVVGYTEGDYCNEEASDGYSGCDCTGHGRSGVRRRHGSQGKADGAASGNLRLERLLHWCKWWRGTESQLLGLCHGGGTSCRGRLRGPVRRSHRWSIGISLA